jgi:hypothetical protein
VVELLVIRQSYLSETVDAIYQLVNNRASFSPLLVPFLNRITYLHLGKKLSNPEPEIYAKNRTVGRSRAEKKEYLFKFFQLSNIDTLCLVLAIFIQPILNFLKLSNHPILFLRYDKSIVLVVDLNT